MKKRKTTSLSKSLNKTIKLQASTTYGRPSLGPDWLKKLPPADVAVVRSVVERAGLSDALRLVAAVCLTSSDHEVRDTGDALLRLSTRHLVRGLGVRAAGR